MTGSTRSPSTKVPRTKRPWRGCTSWSSSTASWACSWDRKEAASRCCWKSSPPNSAAADRRLPRVNLTGISGDEMLWSLAAQFGRNLDRCDSTPVLWRALSDRLAAFRYQQVDAVILIDDADRAGNSVVPHLIRLAKLEPSPQPRLTLILAGDRSTIGRLGDTLLGLSELRIDLAAWQPDDIAGYLDRSLRQAGGSAGMFDEPAIERLYELSHGIPRQVRLLADLSLVAGAGRHLHSIDADVVESVYHELATVEV